MAVVSKDGESQNTHVDGSKINAFEAALFAEAEGGFSIAALHFPGVFSQGENREEAIENVRDAFELMRDCCAEAGQNMEFASTIDFEATPKEILWVQLRG